MFVTDFQAIINKQTIRLWYPKCFHFLLFVALIIALIWACFLWSGGTQGRRVKKIAFANHSSNLNYTLIWAVNIHDRFIKAAQDEDIDNVARELGLINCGQIGHISNHYLFVYDINANYSGKKNAVLMHKFHMQTYNETEILEIVELVENRMDNHEKIASYSHQRLISRKRRFLFVKVPFMNFKDPYYRKQWHLTNTVELGMDVNITDVWKHAITGTGVTVAVVDDGLEWNNPDLYENYNKAGSWDFNGDDDDPMPDYRKETNHHGTRCAGEISAIPNDVCGVGVAHGAKVSGIRLLDGPLYDSLEAEAFTKHFDINDIYSCSWGPDDDGTTVDGPHVLAAAGMKYGIDFGRQGYGSIYVVASGNGGHEGDNCNYDGYANSLYTVTIGAVDDTGHMPFYSEECASMLAVTFSSGSNSFNRDIVTTDWTSERGASRSGCTEHHSGTSAAAPIAAGLIALMLQVQPCLTWRDVQYLIILTALKVDIDIAHWQKNGAGLWHSHKHGFGLMNAWRLVNAAKVWDQVPWLTAVTYKAEHVDLPITKGMNEPLVVTQTVTELDVNSYDLYIVETVQVTMTLSHPCRGHLDIRLKSPSGTISVIGATRHKDNSSAGFDNWTFSTVRCWGESAVGVWTLTIVDIDSSSDYGMGTLNSWTLKLYGTPLTPEQFKYRKRLVDNAVHGKYLNRTSKCFPPPVMSEPDVIMSVKTLKVIVMFGSLCFIFAIYETFEYLCCYGDEKKEQRRTIELLKRAYRLARQHIYGAGNQSQGEMSALINENIPMETLSSVSGPGAENNVCEFDETHGTSSTACGNDDFSGYEGQRSPSALTGSNDDVEDSSDDNNGECGNAAGSNITGPSQGHSFRDKLKTLGSNLNILSDSINNGYSLIPNSADESETEF